MQFTSHVIKGLGKGRKIGYPTINLSIPVNFSLKHGVYGCYVFYKRLKLHGILYFGKRYVDNTAQKILEIHILKKTEHDGKIINSIVHGEKVSVIIGEFIRKPLKIFSITKLQQQIQEDINKLLKYMWKRCGKLIFTNNILRRTVLYTTSNLTLHKIFNLLFTTFFSYIKLKKRFPPILSL